MYQTKPLFSVVIPLYNKEAHISDTLHSVLNQTFTEIEVIIVNDGSTDQSLEVVNAFIDPRLRIFTKQNGGVSEARNYGIQKAQGEYVALLDADDQWEPAFLAEIKILIDKYPSCGLYASAYKKVKQHKTIHNGVEVQEGILDDFFKAIFHHFIPCASGVAIKKEVLDEVGGFPVGMIGGEDDYTWSKIAIHYKVAFTPQVLVIYNATGSSFNSRKGMIDSCKESWFDFYEPGNFYRNEFIARKLLFAGIRYTYHPNQTKSIEIEKFTRYTVLSKKLWRDLYLLNRLPYQGVLLVNKLSSPYKKVKQYLSKVKSNMLSFSLPF